MWNCLVGLVVKASGLKSSRSGVRFLLAGIFSRSCHTNDLKIGTLVAPPPGTWCYRVSAGTGWLGVSIRDWVRQKVWSAISLSVWQHVKLPKQIRPWNRLACSWNVKQPTKKPTLNVILSWISEPSGLTFWLKCGQEGVGVIIVWWQSHWYSVWLMLRWGEGVMCIGCWVNSRN